MWLMPTILYRAGLESDGKISGGYKQLDERNKF